MEGKNVEAVFLYMTQLLDEYKSLIHFNEYQHCRDILKQFYHGYCEYTLSADDLYHMIYKEDEAGKSIFDYANEVEAKETILDMWESILSILLVMTRMAYEIEGAAYIPEDIESIHTEKIDMFFEKVKSNKAPKELLICLKEICY